MITEEMVRAFYGAVTVEQTGTIRNIEDGLRAVIALLPGEPVVWTTHAQLQRAKDNPSANVLMWGEPLPHHPDIPLYATPVLQPVSIDDIDIIEDVMGSYDWLGTGSHYDHKGEREAEAAWSRIRAALVGMDN